MPTFPVRGLGSTGVDTDTHPADIDSVSTFTTAVNVRFANGRASRAPMARTVAALPHEPGHALTIPAGAGTSDQIVSVAADFGSIYRLNGSAFENLTPPGHVGADGDFVTTSCFLGGLSYLNRETHQPLFKIGSADTYAPLPNWPSDTRCKIMRSYKDQLIALGVTRSGELYPTLVKWSDFASFNAPPASWDATSTTNSAGENIVNEMEHDIVDGLTLRESFIIYCTASVWSMDYNGGDFIYTFRKIFDECGVINPNCVVQVGSLHYVFDTNDIYVHDAVAPKSIADGKVKRFIFDAIDYSRSHLCFVTHDARLTEVRFAYPSSDQHVAFPNATTGCNRQAVFNYSTGIWSFYDIPNLTGQCKGAILSGDDWDTKPDATFEDAAGPWLATDGDTARHTLMVGRSDPGMGLSAPRLYGIDILNGGRMSQPVEPEAAKPAFLERVCIDLDATGKNLTQYVNLQAIWPQMSAVRASDTYWQFGASDLVNKEPLWSEEYAFDPEADMKIDINEAGKYLAYRFGCRGTEDFALLGFDCKLVVRGRR